jgi:hypothetical protein
MGVTLDIAESRCAPCCIALPTKVVATSDGCYDHQKTNNGTTSYSEL